MDLLAAGCVDAALPDKFGRNALVLAAHEGREDVVRGLLKRTIEGAVFDAGRRQLKYTPLHATAATGRIILTNAF